MHHTSTLVSVHSYSENNFVMNNVATRMSTAFFWTGLFRGSNSEWGRGGAGAGAGRGRGGVGRGGATWDGFEAGWGRDGTGLVCWGMVGQNSVGSVGWDRAGQDG